MVKIWKLLLLTICVVVTICLLGVRALRSKQAVPPAPRTEPRTQPDPPTQPPTTPMSGRRSRVASDALGQGSLFGPPPAPISPPPLPPDNRPSSPRAPHNRPPSPPASPPAPADPLQNFLYTGYATIGDRSQALLEDRRTHEGTWLGEGDTFQGYIIEHIDPDGIRLRQGETRRDLAMADRFNATPLATDAPITAQPDPGNLTQFRSQVGQSFYFQVTGRLSGSVWGSGPYTDDSDLATASVHAGLLRDGQQGVVRVTVLPGSGRYDGSIRNGVTSNSYGSWDGSYRIDR
jgi:hypothetical protein